MFRVYLIKIRQKIIHLVKKYQPPIKVLSIATFYEKSYQDEKPTSYYFLNRNEPNFFFNPSEYETYATYLKTNFSKSVTTTIANADDAIGHTFDLLGSGKTNLSKKINWHTDFKSGKFWNNDHYTKIQIINQKDNSDIKVPWELSRLQHFTDLGKAFWLTEDETYLREFVSTVENWQSENKIDHGPNWTCSMEIAIRVINIIWGLYFFSAKNLLTDSFVQNTIHMIYYHAMHIEKNLEIIDDGANSNHLLSNYLGLFYIGLLFPQFDRSQKWRQLACEGLEKEIMAEINTDGADYECSTSYHRLVLEIFLSAYILGQKNSYNFSESYKNRLQKMLHFSESITTQSGVTPYIGDNDDGFIIKLSHDNPASHNHLIELGAHLFSRSLPDFINGSEEILFYFGTEKLENLLTRKISSSLFKESGYAVIRSEKLHLLFSATKITPNALGGHKHNDNLSFTLEHNKTPYFIDPGTFCYTSDFAMRNKNRSVKNHNTVAIDSEEQNRFFDSRLFYLFNDSKAEIDLWTNTGQFIIVSGTHRGYARNDSKIIHRRTIQVNLRTSLIEIIDELTGESNREHLFETRFITPVENIDVQKNKIIYLKNNSVDELVMSFDSSAQQKITVTPSEYYPRFGVSKPAQTITRVQKTKLPLINKTSIILQKIKDDNIVSTCKMEELSATV